MYNLIQTTDKGCGIFVVIENDLIGRCINQNGFWEPHLLQFYYKFIRDTDVVLDAGANIGFHSVNLASRAKHVHAFEPQSLIYNILCTNILTNNLTNKTTQYKVALSDKEGTLKMQPLNQFDEKDGVHNFGGRGITSDPAGEEEVKMIAFDSLGIDIDMIKIDIQGSEIYAFNGMLKTLEKNKPWIMLENYEDHENDEKVLILLKNLGYEIYRLQYQPREDCIAIHSKNDNHNEMRVFLDEELKQFYKKI